MDIEKKKEHGKSSGNSKSQLYYGEHYTQVLRYKLIRDRKPV